MAWRRRISASSRDPQCHAACGAESQPRHGRLHGSPGSLRRHDNHGRAERNQNWIDQGGLEKVPSTWCLGAEDGIRTRDPHLGKVMDFLCLGPRVPECGSVHPVSSSSTPSAPVVERLLPTAPRLTNGTAAAAPWLDPRLDRVKDGVVYQSGTPLLVPAGIIDRVQSLPRSGQVIDRDGRSDGSEQEPRTDHAGDPKCFPFPCQRHSRTSGDVDDRPDDYRERCKSDEAVRCPFFLSSAKRGPLLSPRSSPK